jgi:phage terminase large subunit-like protein
MGRGGMTMNDVLSKAIETYGKEAQIDKAIEEDSEAFVNVTDVQSCKVCQIDWQGRIVYVGLDLSQTDDNTSVSMWRNTR